MVHAKARTYFFSNFEIPIRALNRLRRDFGTIEWGGRVCVYVGV